MLLIQNICLTWDKEHRGAKGEQARRRFPPACFLEKMPCSGDVIVHHLNFIQKGNTFADSASEIRRSLEKALSSSNFSQTRIQKELGSRLRWVQQHRLQAFHSAEALNLTNLSVCLHEAGCSVTFFYDERRSGRPVRRGHNQDFQNPDSPFYRKDILNETAFTLTPGQYGRILWNERTTDCDTGEWYYQLHIYNLYYAPGRTFPNDIFVRKRPDVEYRQLAALD